jgi:hypothetical protein
MKIEQIAGPGILVLGIVGIAATALLGFAAGVAVGRDPEVLRRTARRVARGLEQTTLMAAQAREYVGDLWAEAREEARAEVDAADFERAAARAHKAAPAAAAAASRGKATRKRASRPRKPKQSRAAVAESAAQDAAGQA